MVVLTPGAMTRLRENQNMAFVERAIHELVLSTWNGRKSRIEVSRLLAKIENIAGYKIYDASILITRVLDKYSKSGWSTYEDHFYIILEDAAEAAD